MKLWRIHLKIVAAAILAKWQQLLVATQFPANEIAEKQQQQQKWQNLSQTNGQAA